MPNTLPIIRVATLCDKVLQEKDDAISAIRMIDVIYVDQGPAGLPADIKGIVPLTALIMLTSGDVTGEHILTVKFRRPDGTVVETEGEYPILMNGALRGANVILHFQIHPTTFGLFWMDVYFDRALLTSIPFTLVQGLPETQTAPTRGSASTQ